MAFCLYVAARVFVQTLKRKPEDQDIYSHLNLLLAAMRTLQRKNHLTESFLVQLNLDMESSGLDIFRNPDYSAIYMECKVRMSTQGFSGLWILRLIETCRRTIKLYRSKTTLILRIKAALRSVTPLSRLLRLQHQPNPHFSYLVRGLTKKTNQQRE